MVSYYRGDPRNHARRTAQKRKAVFDMKKILCIIFAAVMLFSLLTLTSCNKGKDVADKTKQTETKGPAPDTAGTGSETESGEPVPAVDLNEMAQKFADGAPCYTHMQFGAASTLTEEALGQAILEWLEMPDGYEVEFDRDSFDAFHESFQGEGDGCSAGGFITFDIKNSATGETSDTVSPFFYIEKNLEREDWEFTVCPDEAD